MNELMTIGVILNDESKQGLNHTYFSTVLESLKCALEKENISLLFLSNGRESSDSKSYLKQAIEYGCKGIVLACCEFCDEIVEVLEGSLPVVSIDNVYDNAYCVTSDNKMGMRMLAEYLIEMGHKRIAYITGDDNEVSNIRLNGFLAVCEKHHISIPEEYILRGKFRDMDKSIYCTENLLNSKNPPSCIIYSDDYAAIGGINILKARGLTIGRDISIAAYDGDDLISKFEPKLTTIRQDGVKMGQVAAEKMVEAIKNESKRISGVHTVDVCLEKGRTIRQVFE